MMLGPISREVMDAIFGIVIKESVCEDPVIEMSFKYRVSNEIYTIIYDTVNMTWELANRTDKLVLVYGGIDKYQETMVIFSSYLELR